VESPPAGTVTLLFTDIEGSTRRSQDEPEAVRALLAEHDAIPGGVIQTRDG
jgi:class 3 adenylate cyclase